MGDISSKDAAPFRKLAGADEIAIGNIGDRLKVSDSINDFMLEVTMGNITGMKEVLKFGHNPTVGNVFETVWTQSSLYVWATSAEKVNVKSADSNDTVTGTGARTVRIEGLDSSYVEISETINLNGTSNVLSSNSYLRLHRIVVVTAGSNGSNNGSLTAQQQTSGILMCDIEAGRNQSLAGFYTVPAGKTAYMTSWYRTIEENKECEFVLLVRPEAEVFQTKSLVVSENQGVKEFRPYFKILEKSDIELRGKRIESGIVAASGGFDIILVDN